MKKKKTYSYYKIMEAILQDNYVDCWNRLYDRLGITKWFEDRNTPADVKYIYMTQDFEHYVDLILRDRYATGRGKKQIFWWRKNTSTWDSVCYSPVYIEYGKDCIIVDITQKTDKYKSKDFHYNMPLFKE
jgi:hypothetical protein